MTCLDQALETGFASVDQDHRVILGQIDSIRRALELGEGRGTIARLIQTLLDYVLVHFASEENIMERVCCPALEVNRAQHLAFRRRVEGWLELLSTPGSPECLATDVEREAAAWIIRHISEVDCKLRGCRHRISYAG